MFRHFAKVFGIGLFFFTVAIAVGFFIFFDYGRNLPNYEFLKHYQSPTSTRIYSRNLTLVKEFSKENRIALNIEKIPGKVKQAFLIAEDKNFYYHIGVDLMGLWRAFFNNLLHQRWKEKAVGASTITQQVAKNLLVGNEKSLARKIREAIMAFRLETSLSKDRILEIYLNEIYLGSGFYGVAAASLGYFGKPLNELSIAEIAYLASLPKAPSLYHPIRDKKKAINRRNWVIHRMLQEGIISQPQATQALSEDLIVKQDFYSEEGIGEYYIEEVRRMLLQAYGEKSVYQGGLNVITTLDQTIQKHADQALSDGLIEYETRHGWRGAIKNIDIKKLNQNQLLSELKLIPPLPHKKWVVAVVNKVEENFATIALSSGENGKILLKDTLWAKPWNADAREGTAPKKMGSIVTLGDIIYIEKVSSEKNDDIYKLRQLPAVTGAITVTDPETGEILALTGGFDFSLNQFNCATQAWRQPGSSFKPFVYLTALEKGFTPESIIEDKPIHVDLGNGLGVYSPKNYSKTSYGAMPLKNGIIYSYNLMTVNLAQQIGMKSIQKTVSALGIMDEMPLQLAMSLGAGETTMIRLCNAYASIINHGKRVKPIFIKAIHNHSGHVIEESTSPFIDANWQNLTKTQYDPNFFHQHLVKVDNRNQVISIKHANTMRNLLIDVVTKGNGHRVKCLTEKYNIIVGGKTGTTNDYKDAWFMGFIQLPNKKTYIIGCFIGFPFPKTLGVAETGGRAATPIFNNFVEYAIVHLFKINGL